jgi:acetylornithine deacetylase
MQPVEYLEQLMRIESHETVDEIQQYLLNTLEGATLDETGCVYAEKEGSEDGPRIILNTHLDVVSPHIEFERDGDLIRGRGACDAKGSLAPMAIAFSRLNVGAGSLNLLISPDEETTQRGLYEYLSDGIEGDFVIVGEPTGMDICPSARGHYDLEIELFGKSAHGATPESGINTTICAAEAITNLGDLPRVEDEELGTNNFTPTIIEGGNRPNQVPEYTKFIVDYRTIPAETREDAVKNIKRVLEDLDCEFEISYYEDGSALDSFKIDRNIERISQFSDAIRHVTGTPPTIRPFDAATEAAFFAPSMPVIVFGPGLISDGNQPIAHSEREYVPVAEVEQATDVLFHFLSEQLG